MFCLILCRYVLFAALLQTSNAHSQNEYVSSDENNGCIFSDETMTSISLDEICDERLGSSCYVLVTEAMMWEAAKNCCQTIGGHLAIIESCEENDLIRQLVTRGKFLVLVQMVDRCARIILTVLAVYRIGTP